jgi:hypothetical protein
MSCGIGLERLAGKRRRKPASGSARGPRNSTSEDCWEGAGLWAGVGLFEIDL